MAASRSLFREHWRCPYGQSSPQLLYARAKGEREDGGGGGRESAPEGRATLVPGPGAGGGTPCWGQSRAAQAACVLRQGQGVFVCLFTYGYCFI